MFPSSKTRFRSAARRSLDLAVEFATLGEYRVPAPAEDLVRARRSAPLRPPRPTISIERRATRLAPASAAARRLRPPAGVVPIVAADAVRSLAMAGAGAASSPRPRRRGGQPVAQPQPCVTAGS